MNLLNNTSRGARLARILLRTPFAAASLSAFLAVSSATTSQAKDLPSEGPIAVEVQGPVEVVGVVDVLSQPKKVRYIQSKFIGISSGAQGGAESFTIPEGKMLVVETVSVSNGLASTGTKVFASLGVGAVQGGDSWGSVALPMNYEGVDGGSVFMATLPVMLRVDSSQNSLIASVWVFPHSGSATFYVSVFGYLEDL